MHSRLRTWSGCIGHLVFLLAGMYLVSAILIPSIGGTLRFGTQSGYPSAWQDGGFWLTVAIAGTSLLFFLLALVNGVQMLSRLSRREPLAQRNLLLGVVGTLGCLLPTLMIPDTTISQYPMMQPKWPPLPEGLVRHICLEGGDCFTFFFFLFGLSLAGCLFACIGIDRPAAAKDHE